MDDFHLQSDSVASAALSTRTSANAVRAVHATVAGGMRDSPKASLKNAPRADAGLAAKVGDGTIDHLSSAAEFARAHQKISALLSELKSTDSNRTIDGIAEEMTDLLPVPTVVIPMPPASNEMMERAIAIAEKIRSDALMSRAAQAHVSSDMAEAIFA